MARRIRWQLLIAALSSLVIVGLMGSLAVSRTAVARPSSGGAYIEAVVGAPQQLNPLLNDPLADPVGADIAALLFEGLMRPGQGGIPEPLLAARLPELSADGLVYTFTLRSDLRWHDGAPLTADDVVWTLRTLKRPEFTGPRALAALWQGVLVDKLDEQRVQFTLSAPYGPFPSAATVPILPAHLLSNVSLAEWPSALFNRNPVGSGPYRLLVLDEQGAQLVANRQYHGAQPLIDQLNLRFVRDTDDALAALESGAVQAFGYNATRQPSQNVLPPETTLYNTPLDDYSVLTFNLRRAPLDDVAVRRALARGLDKQQLINSALEGRAVPLDTPILPGWWAFNPAATWYAPEAVRAGETLGELGYVVDSAGVRARNGRPLALTLICDGASDRVAAAQEIARQWGAIGVAVDVEQLDGPTLEQRLRDREFDLALHGWARLGADPDVFELWHSSQGENGANYAGLDDAQIDEALVDGRTQSDYAARARSYAAFQRRWIELVPSITLYQPLFSYTARSSVGLPDFQQPGGSALLFGPADRFRGVTRWYVNSEREIRGDLRGPR